jgi:hypothetical protein
VIVSSQCGRDVEGREDDEAIPNLTCVIEVEGQDKSKDKKSAAEAYQALKPPS